VHLPFPERIPIDRVAIFAVVLFLALSGFLHRQPPGILALPHGLSPRSNEVARAI
jgi:hypothetical protein